MFNLKVQTCYQSKTSQEDAIAHRLEELLKEIISKESPFEDHADFLLWSEESLPLIHWQKHPSSENEISIYLLFWSSSEIHPELFFTALKRKLATGREVLGMSLEHFDFTLRDVLHKKLSVAEVRFSTETALDADRIFNLLPSMAEELLLEVKAPLYGHYLAHQAKPVLVQDKIAKFKRRFYSKTDEHIFEEMRSFLAIAEPKFIEQRSCHLLSRLVISQYFIHKALLKALANTPDARHVFYRLLPSNLSSPFASKKVLGIFVGVNFLHKYDVFNEEHVLRALQRLSLDVQCVPGGSYSFQRHGEPFKFLYVEVEKKDEKPFSFKQYKQLRSDLKEILKSSVERLQPSVFMVSNEEEVIKNTVLLNREINSPSDLPQVMIHFEEQTDKDACFQIILVSPSKMNFSRIQDEAVYLPNWTHIIRYLKKKHPVQAHVFKIRIPKTQVLLRSDASLNFYAARQKISDLLRQTIGKFRDYNGGLILKQGEVLAQFKQLFNDDPPETVENFFYGLIPLEIQAIIPLSNLATFFELFLEGKHVALDKPHDCFAKFLRKERQTFCMFLAKDPSFVDDIKNSFTELKLDPTTFISTRLTTEDKLALGYIFEHETESQHTEFIKALQIAVEAWKKKLSNIKTLRLAISSGLRPLDPRIQANEDTKLILKMLFEGLMRVDARGEVELGVAQGVTISTDRKKYTFELRPTYWSNGVPVLAGDFVYAWKTLLSPHFKTPSAYLFYPIKNARAVKEGRLSPESLGLRALNSHTLEIELEYPVSYFLELLAQPQFSPISPAIDRSQPTWPHQEGESYVSNGAFLLKKNHPTQGYELIKNPSYPSVSEISLDGVSIKNAQSGEIREMFLRDEIDWLGFPTGTVDLSSLPLEHGETIALPNDSLYWYVFNTQCFPFNHAKLRRAFAYAVNRARILQGIPPGHWPAFSILPFQYSRGPLMEESQQKGIDLFEEALRELELDRKSFPILKLLHIEGKIRDKVAKVIKQEWEEAFGVCCQIEAYSWDEIFNRLTEGNFQVCGINWINLLDDPNYTLHIFQNASKFINFSKWTHPSYEQLLDQSNREKKRSKRLDYCALAEAILLQEAPVIPLTRSLPCSIKKNRVEMLCHGSLKSWDFKWASIRSLQNKE